MATCFLGLLLSVLVTLIPSLVVIALLWWLDRYEKEPLWLLGIVFFWGAVPTIVLSLLAQIILDVPLTRVLGHSVLYPLTTMSIVAPLTEETFKALILLALFLFYRQEFDGVVDGILYGARRGHRSWIRAGSKLEAAVEKAALYPGWVDRGYDSARHPQRGHRSGRGNLGTVLCAFDCRGLDGRAGDDGSHLAGPPSGKPVVRGAGAGG